MTRAPRKLSFMRSVPLSVFMYSYSTPTVMSSHASARARAISARAASDSSDARTRSGRYREVPFVPGFRRAMISASDPFKLRLSAAFIPSEPFSVATAAPSSASSDRSCCRTPSFSTFARLTAIAVAWPDCRRASFRATSESIEAISFFSAAAFSAAARAWINVRWTSRISLRSASRTSVNATATSTRETVCARAKRPLHGNRCISDAIAFICPSPPKKTSERYERSISGFGQSPACRSLPRACPIVEYAARIAGL